MPVANLCRKLFIFFCKFASGHNEFENIRTKLVFFFNFDFLSLNICGPQNSKEREKSVVIPLYLLHLLLVHLGISRTITAESSRLHIFSNRAEPIT